jgi:hypothetical protein
MRRTRGGAKLIFGVNVAAALFANRALAFDDEALCAAARDFSERAEQDIGTMVDGNKAKLSSPQSTVDGRSPTLQPSLTVSATGWPQNANDSPRHR